MSSGKAIANINVNSFGHGIVNLRVAGVPSGVGATLSQQSLVSGKVTLTFTSSPSAIAQNVPITIWATGGPRVHSVTFYLQVTPFATTQTTPTISWPTPAGIVYGAALSSTQLAASLSVPGTCTFLPSAGTVLKPGTQTISANCSPTDTVAYKTPAAATVSLTVSKAPLTVTASTAELGRGHRGGVVFRAEPHGVQRQRPRCAPGLQRDDEGVRPARDQLRVPFFPRVGVAEQPFRAGFSVRPQPVAHVGGQPDPAVLPRLQRQRRQRPPQPGEMDVPAVQRVVHGAVPAAALRAPGTAQRASGPAPACTAPHRTHRTARPGACRSTSTARRGTPPAAPVPHPPRLHPRPHART